MSASWDEIPSIEDLKMDWEYEPENPLGKRSAVRLSRKQLHRIVGKNSVPVKIAPMVWVKLRSKKINDQGVLVDLSAEGLAVSVDFEMDVETPVKVGFFLGKRKIISKGIVKNVSALEGDYRLGIEFVQLDEESVLFISSLSSSAVYKL